MGMWGGCGLEWVGWGWVGMGAVPD